MTLPLLVSAVFLLSLGCSGAASPPPPNPTAQAAAQAKARRCEQLSRQLEAALQPIAPAGPNDGAGRYETRLRLWFDTKNEAQKRYDEECKS